MFRERVTEGYCAIKRLRLLFVLLVVILFVSQMILMKFQRNTRIERDWWNDITDVQGAEDPADVWDKILRTREVENNITVPDPP